MFNWLLALAVVGIFVLHSAGDGIDGSPSQALFAVELAAFALGELFVWDEFGHGYLLNKIQNINVFFIKLSVIRKQVLVSRNRFERF